MSAAHSTSLLSIYTQNVPNSPHLTRTGKIICFLYCLLKTTRDPLNRQSHSIQAAQVFAESWVSDHHCFHDDKPPSKSLEGNCHLSELVSLLTGQKVPMLISNRSVSTWSKNHVSLKHCYDLVKRMMQLSWINTWLKSYNCCQQKSDVFVHV